MNATQVFEPEFDKNFFRLPPNIQENIQSKIDHLGRNLSSFPHFRMKGHPAFRVRIGDYRVIYEVDIQNNILYLVTVGNRKSIYRNF